MERSMTMFRGWFGNGDNDAAPAIRQAGGNGKWSPDHRHHASMVELFRSLGSALSGHPSGKIILFTSCRAGEGRTRVIGELASMLALETQHRIAIIDAGPRQELTARYGGGATAPLRGLIGSLERSPAQEPRSVSRLVFAAADAAALPLLEAPAAWNLLRSAFDYVLVEMPAFADSALCLSIAKYVDGVVLVVESGRTRWPIVQNAREQLERAGAPLLGVFLNKRVHYVPRALYDRL